MDRRKFLGIISTGAIVTTAGCMDDSSVAASPEEKESTTESAQSQTQNETDQPPVVETVSLVTEWIDYGDIKDNSISAAASGSEIVIAFRYESTVHENEHHVTYQVRIRDEEEKRIAQESNTDKQLVGYSGRDVWEASFVLDTEGWGRGKYKAEILVKDEITGLTSKSEIGDFELTEPLHSSEVGFISIDAPSRIKAGEDYQFTFKIRNTSDRDGTFRSRLSAKYGRFEWEMLEGYFDLTVASGSVGEWTSGKWAPEEGEYTFRMDAIDETWDLVVEGN